MKEVLIEEEMLDFLAPGRILYLDRENKTETSKKLEERARIDIVQVK